ncbi:MAG TPA: formylglycine-generating enzyme family protein [Rhodothermales bacterium]|nr:formylglycine-generating enzyme family protein [Rhodothermales bacterium]
MTTGKLHTTSPLSRILMASAVCLALTAAALVAPHRHPAADEAPEGMAYVGGGWYTPLYPGPADEGGSSVEPFFLDVYPVTNAEYLAFVRANPEWQRSRVPSLFADGGYLRTWPGDLDFGPDTLADRPVVNVSWFAASAFAEWKGKRLPTTAEWEVAAAASPSRPDGRNDPAYRQYLLDWYSRTAPDVAPPVGSTFRNYWGVYDLHGLVWEWVFDFNTEFVSSDSRNRADLDATLFCGGSAVRASSVDDYAAFLRSAYRNGFEASYTAPNLGFRLAQDVPSRTSSSTETDDELLSIQ